MRISPTQFGLLRYIRSLVYLGNKFFCPVCEGHFRKFKPSGKHLESIVKHEIIGTGVLKNSRCPRCSSRSRDRLLFLYLQTSTSIFTNSHRLFHVAPETCLEIWLKKAPKLDYLTADLNPVGVMRKVDITQVPFPDGQFDFILCNHVLEHILEDRKAMMELFRILEPGGKAILQVPISRRLPTTYEDASKDTPQEREEAFGQHDHVRIYALQDYVSRLEETGFQVEVIEWINTPSLQQLGSQSALDPLDPLFICKKA